MSRASERQRSRGRARADGRGREGARRSVSRRDGPVVRAAAHDPRAFMIDLMETDQIDKLKKTLKGADRQRFNKSLQTALDSGAIVRQ